jgi:hypothetical protein
MTEHMPEGPAMTACAAVQPDDKADLPYGASAALWVGKAGALAVIMRDGTPAVFDGAVGWLPISVIKVRKTGTKAGNIVALYRRQRPPR